MLIIFCFIQNGQWMLGRCLVGEVPLKQGLPLYQSPFCVSPSRSVGRYLDLQRQAHISDPLKAGIGLHYGPLAQISMESKALVVGRFGRETTLTAAAEARHL